MRKTLLVIFFLQFLVLSNAQSIVVNGATDAETNYGAEQLLTDVLLDGGLCSSTSNFQLRENTEFPFPNANRSWGFFKKGSSTFPFERGIVLTSGYAKDAEGPDSGTMSMGTSAWTGDSDADVLAGISTRNATVFEFDFVPQGNEISFNYIFASEEYPEWACSDYNDVFGFIISGPGITNDPGLSGKNIALLPNGDPVTINNVNNQNCGDDTYYVHGPFTTIEYGGRTTPLTAYSEVTPGETYHIRLLIADASDTNFDSAVFLEAGSFNLGSTIVDDGGVDIGDDLMVCGQDEYTLYVNVDDPAVDLQWYKNGEIIDGATTNSLVINESAIYSIEVTSGDCSATDEVNVVFGDLQTNGTNFYLELTDDNNDGSEIFNLTLVEPQIVDTPADYTFGYFLTQNEADNNTNPIDNPNAHPGQHGDVVYVRVENADGCYAVVNLNLRLEANDNPCDFIPICSNEDIFDEPEPHDPIQLISSCVDFTADETLWYYLVIEEGSTFTFTISPDTANDYDFMLWQNVEDCNLIPQISGVQPGIEATRASYDAPGAGEYDTGLMMDETDLCEGAVPAGGSVDGFVRHLDVQPGDQIIIAIYKFSSGGGFTLSFGGDAVLDCTIVGELDYAECDNDGDGQVQFDLAEIAEEITNGDTFLNVTYYATEEDATNDTGLNTIPTEPYTVTTATSPDVIYAQVKNDAGEVEEILTLTLSISEGVTGAQNASYFACDLGEDGTEIIDLTEIEVISNPENYTIRYYEEEQDAIDGNATFISNPSAYEASTSTIYVRIENENGCFVIVEISLDISSLAVDLGEGFSMCEGEFDLTANGDFSGFTNVTFTWTLNGNVIEGATTQTITISEPGTYGVTVDTDEGCSGSDTVTVTPGESPTITNVTVGPDYVIVEATGGVTPYQYSITGYVWQDSNQFNYLQPGIHTVYVRSAEGCIVSQEFAVFFIPTMFTPNGDGINDTWNIPGLEIYPGSNVTIYDRNGRLVHQANLESNVIWNGFFVNGQKAPTQDYWYVINVSDGRQFTGHITVKSRGEKQ
ncbi:T9SS type B sorting domain-containing protein [Moheibacter lacus]|uniref:T9SS type B sorting domain-containing protein n=1 Tax=Moheibacter lacus TaxID=2745851 RepID=A0A838ZLA4_9FLAO|nr:choice-of-anchor L domain-containing protein [Moheibacter lacus]MBA5629244.1 T9SS type B sorting domain-containing protein [Moheibacter lacus]